MGECLVSNNEQIGECVIGCLYADMVENDSVNSERRARRDWPVSYNCGPALEPYRANAGCCWRH